MEKFRTQHLKLAAQYINQEATKVRGCPLNRIQELVRPVNDNIEIDTGGTPFMRYLKKNRDVCRHHKFSVDRLHK